MPGLISALVLFDLLMGGGRCPSLISACWLVSTCPSLFGISERDMPTPGPRKWCPISRGLGPRERHGGDPKEGPSRGLIAFTRAARCSVISFFRGHPSLPAPKAGSLNAQRNGSIWGGLSSPQESGGGPPTASGVAAGLNHPHSFEAGRQRSRGASTRCPPGTVSSPR